MKDQLVKYVDLLFAGAADASEIKQEILQNTLDKYDDLIAQGKVPAAAYSLAISGIGDVSEILVSTASSTQPVSSSPVQQHEEGQTDRDAKAKRAAAIAMYIASPIPLFLLGNIGSGVWGLCLMFLLIAAATALIILSRSSKHSKAAEVETPVSAQQETRNAVKKVVSTVGLVVYFVISFSTQAWYITWLVFPITAAAQGLINACMDLKEAKQNAL